MRNVAIEFERISDVGGGGGGGFEGVVDVDTFDAEAAEADGGVDGSLTLEFGGVVVFIMEMGLSRPTSTTSIFTDEHLVALKTGSLSPFALLLLLVVVLVAVVRFCGDNDCGSGGGGGKELSGELVAERFEDVDVDVEDIEFAADICGFIVAIVCGDMRDKCGERCVSCKC